MSYNKVAPGPYLPEETRGNSLWIRGGDGNMWNWKLVHEDGESLWYCDIDSISDSEEDEDGVYRSADCYQSLSRTVAIWTSIFVKSKEKVVRYVGQRKKKGLPVKGYQGFSNFLSVIEIDLGKKQYRVIPAIDYDKAGIELSQSAVLDDETESILPGIKSDWAPVQPRKTHKAIQALYKFISA
jgi:hypothetical protein